MAPPLPPHLIMHLDPPTDAMTLLLATRPCEHQPVHNTLQRFMSRKPLLERSSAECCGVSSAKSPDLPHTCRGNKATEPSEGSRSWWLHPSRAVCARCALTPPVQQAQSGLEEGEPLTETAGADECVCNIPARTLAVSVHPALSSLVCQRGWAQTSPVGARQFGVRRQGAASPGAPR